MWILAGVILSLIGAAMILYGVEEAKKEKPEKETEE